MAAVAMVITGCGRTGIGGLDEFGSGETQASGTTTGTGTGSETGTGTSSSTGVIFDLPGGEEESGESEESGGEESTESGTTGDGDGDGDGDTGTTESGGPMCGDGIIDPGEQCDGDNLGGITCIDLGYTSGELGCDPVVCVFDASACVIDMTTGGTTG